MRKVRSKIVKLLFVGVFGFLLFSASPQIIQSFKSSPINHAMLIEKASAIETGVAIPGHGSTFNDFMSYIRAIFDFSLKLGVALTTLMLIYAGYKYMTSQGNPTAINEAKDIFIGSLSGFVMLLLIYLILNVYNLRAP